MKQVLLTIYCLTLLQCKPVTSETPKSAVELQEELQTLEQRNPTQYLTIENGTVEPNIVRRERLFREAKTDGYIVKGVIKNTATLAQFKDVVITIQSYSKTQTLIDESHFVIYELINPKSSKIFSSKVELPSAQEYRVLITDAKAVY